MTDKDKLYKEFLEHYPKDKLATMTLDEYTNLVPNESFCNWIESKLKVFGSIWGSTSYKFGIFRMRGEPNDNSKFQHDDKFTWNARYGAKNAQTAFEIVRKAIVDIADYASKQDLASIEKIDILNGMYKWKIAYLYSGMWIVPIYKLEWLKVLCEHFGMPNASKANTAEWQQFLIERRGNTEAYEYYEGLLSTLKSLMTVRSKKVWLYSPGENASYWQECQEKGIMAIGWSEMGDLRQYDTKEDIIESAKAIYDNNSSMKQDGHCLWQYVNEMRQGDIIIAKNGVNALIGKGIVTGDYEYDEKSNDFPNVRTVKWETIGNWEIVGKMPQKTLTGYDENSDKAKKFIGIIDGTVKVGNKSTQSTYDKAAKQYWWLLAKPKIFSFSEMGIGETAEWTLYNESGAKRHIFQNFIDAKTGDVVFCYQATPTKQVVAFAEVSRESDGETIQFRKVENLLTPIDYSEIKDNETFADMEFMKNPNGSFFKVTLDEAAELMEMIRAENPIRRETKKYTRQDFLNEVYLPATSYERLRTLLENKKNIILQGAPGVGKTFSAKRLAYSILGEEDNSHVEVVQFHQNYSYEDFIMGYKPTEYGGFELKRGLFYNVCKKAAADDPKAK